MTCPYCGTQFADGTTYCPTCGAPQAAPAAPAAPAYTSNPYGNPAPNPYGNPAPNPYGNPAPNPYGNPNPYGVPNPYAPYGAGYAQPKPSVSFGEAIKLYFSNYANFSGRSRRSEYWYACLFNFLVSLIIGSIPVLSWIWSIAVLVPGLSICVRRLHDIGKSGWWYLLNLIPLVGSIILIVWFCTDSTPNNQWGPNPKYS